MCLACEMDALWFAEMEAASATPGTAGVPPASSGEASSNEITLSHGGPSISPRELGEVPRAGETPAGPASTFLCEETRSE